MFFGEFEGGNFVSGSIDSSDRGRLFAYDGRALYQCAESVGRRIFLHKDTPNWPQQHRDYLTSPGFCLHAVPGGGVTSSAAAGVVGSTENGADH